MLRFSNTTVVTSSLLVLAAMSASCTHLPAQQRVQQPGNAAPVARAPQKPSPELWKLLGDWAAGSKGVKKLHGKHQRRSYDNVYKIEKLAKGEFWYESPDKGRIDVQSVKITPDRIKSRNDPKAQVQRDSKTGKPYELKSDDPERWICDGTNVFDIDDPGKTARVAKLPPELRGQGIMNSPLPFLFGLPPQDAIMRFDLTIKKDYRPAHKLVWIEALPRTRKDSQNWSKADVMLNTGTWLPKDVKLVNPAGTKATQYSFHGMEVNKNGIIDRLLGPNPWDPKLPRDYKIHVIQPDQQQPSATPAGQNPGLAIVPNVVGMPHDQATKVLLSVGIPEGSIDKQRGGSPPNAKLLYHVREQIPKAGAPISNVKKFTMVIYDQPAGAARAGKPVGGAAVRPVSNRTR